MYREVIQNKKQRQRLMLSGQTTGLLLSMDAVEKAEFLDLDRAAS